MKLISWNVNGLRAVVGKGFDEIFRSFDADFFCLQETKMQAGQLDLQFEGYNSYWNYADKKGYSGTAIYTKHQPLSVTYGMGIDEHDHEGRIITLEMPDFYLGCVYVPNAQEGLKRLDYRMQWEDDFRNYIHSLESSGLSKNADFNEDIFAVRQPDCGKPKGVVICGDLNVAHKEIDIKNAASNRRNAGFTDEEREKFTIFLNSGYIDTWRLLNPDTVKYSWWSYRFRAREKNAGWRIDYFIVSESLKDRITGAEIHNDIFGSDHCPIELDSI